MSMPHNFSDDPKAFPGPEPSSNNTQTIIIVLASILGVVVLVCGGLITAGVFMAKKASQEFEQFAEQIQIEMEAGQEQMAEYQAGMASGDYEVARQAVDQRLALAPEDATAHNNKAWLLATCPVEEFRDGELAVVHGKKACELTNWEMAAFIDTLAAAHAEKGDFEAAAEWQQKAIDADVGTLFGDGFQERLALYQSGQPYREGPDSATSMNSQGGFSFPADTGVQAVESVFDEPTADEPASDEPASDGATDSNASQE